MNVRIWIVRTFWTGGSALGIVAISAILSGVLRMLGDTTGADAVQGVTLVGATVFALAFVALVLILAINELNRDNSSGTS